MIKIFIAFIFSIFAITAYSQETEEKVPSINQPSCISICGKQFLRQLDDNREVFFGKSNTVVTDEAKSTIDEILKILSEKDIKQKVVILLTSYTEKGNSQKKIQEANQRVEAIKRYFLMYGFEINHLQTEVKPYATCTESKNECAKYSRKVNINTKGLPPNIPSN